MATYEIDGANFSTIDGFYDEISRVLIPGATWGRNLDAFNDILWGGFGTPEEGFVLVWENHHLSRDRLGSDFDTLVEILRDHETEHPLDADAQLTRSRDIPGRWPSGSRCHRLWKAQATVPQFAKCHLLEASHRTPLSQARSRWTQPSLGTAIGAVSTKHGGLLILSLRDWKTW
jgi:RNAse (barnase) inhibitor barstar